MILPISVKAGQLLLITVFCIYVFYTIYIKLCKRGDFDAIYMATMNQTLNGGGITPRTTTEQMVVAVQCILAFFISTGLLIVSFSL
jgi:hypothetical protein